MTKKQKAQFIVEKLNELFPDPQVPLSYKDPYTLLVAVILSAQCTDARVNIVTKELFRVADTPEKMVVLGQERLEKIIHSVGLSKTKSKNIWNMSRILVEDYHCQVPRTLSELEKLPGVGHKTASVVVSHAFDTPAFPVDTHIHRLMHRWGLSDGTNVVQTEKDAKKLFPKQLWYRLHLQIILYGRTYSPARGFSMDKDIITATLMQS